MRGIRGAVNVPENTAAAIGEATRKLLLAMMLENEADTKDIVSVMFTMTKDLNAAFPAASARQIKGWNLVPMLCAEEVDVPGSMGKCIRVLMLANTNKNQRDIKHVYLGEAVKLRPDLGNPPPNKA